MLHNSYIDIAEEYTKKYGTRIADSRTTELTSTRVMEEDVLQGQINADTLRSADLGLNDNIFTFGRTARYVTEWVNEDETTNISLRFSYDSRGPVMEVWYEYIEPNNDI